VAKNITPNAQGKSRRAQKRLRKHLRDIRNAGSLTAGQRDQLFANILEDMILLKLRQLGNLREDD
jgi:hypothetical protein